MSTKLSVPSMIGAVAGSAACSAAPAAPPAAVPAATRAAAFRRAASGVFMRARRSVHLVHTSHFTPRASARRARRRATLRSLAPSSPRCADDASSRRTPSTSTTMLRSTLTRTIRRAVPTVTAPARRGRRRRRRCHHLVRALRAQACAPLAECGAHRVAPGGTSCLVPLGTAGRANGHAAQRGARSRQFHRRGRATHIQARGVPSGAGNRGDLAAAVPHAVHSQRRARAVARPLLLG